MYITIHSIASIFSCKPKATLHCTWVAVVSNYFLIYNAELMSMVTRTPYSGGSLGYRLSDAVVYYFVKYTPVDYKIYTFYQLERIATANPENGIEQETIGIIFNWDISKSHSNPSAMANIAWHDSSNVTNLI